MLQTVKIARNVVGNMPAITTCENTPAIAANDWGSHDKPAA